MRFLVDAQLPPAMARRIETHGHLAQHVADCGLANSTDSAIRMYAAKSSAVIVTKDEDFADYCLLHGGPSIVWVRLGNLRKTVLLGRIDAVLAAVVDALESGETLVEIR